MDAFSPDFVPFWNASSEASDDRSQDRDARHAGDEEALAELAERVSAARSIV